MVRVPNGPLSHICGLTHVSYGRHMVRYAQPYGLGPMLYAHIGYAMVRSYMATAWPTHHAMCHVHVSFSCVGA